MEESWKDFWKTNKRGEKTLKALMLAQPIGMLIFMKSAYDITQNQEKGHGFDKQRYIQYYDLFVSVWLYLTGTYFLFDSINKQVVVELGCFAVVITCLQMFSWWRLIDQLFIGKLIEIHDDMDEQTKTMIQVQRITNYIGIVVCPLFLIFMLSIAKAVFEDIKDDIFLALGGGQNIWSYYYLTSKSFAALKCDIFGNLMFWVGYHFMIRKYQGVKIGVYQWTTYGFVFLLLIPTTIQGFKTVKSDKVTQFKKFFAIRTLLEALKVYAIVVIWLDRTILWKQIIPDEYPDEKIGPFFTTSQYLRLKIYLTLNASFTFFVSFWAMKKMMMSYHVRIKNHRDLMQAKDMSLMYSNYEKDDYTINGNNLRERILQEIQ